MTRRRFALVAACVFALSACSPERPPDVVLITLDTTRADHLGAYGYAKARTPRFDAFAARAVLYENAYSTSSWTLPSHASLFTGLLPMQHGAQTAPEGSSRELGYTVRPLAADFATLAERLHGAGYRTGAVVGGPALRRELGVAQGFEIYDDAFHDKRVVYNGRRAEEVADHAIAIAAQFGDSPYLLFVNFFDPHAPYRPPGARARGIPAIDPGPLTASAVERLRLRAAGEDPGPLEDWQRAAIEQLIAGYDAEIAYLDGHLGRLLDAIGDDAFVAITADHGESFGEHDQLSHGAHLYEDNVRVPLVVRYPDGRGAGTTVAEPVQNHRLFGAILAAAGVPAPGVPRLEAGAAAPIVTEVRRSDSNVGLFGAVFDRDLLAVYAHPFKLITSTTGAIELFDLARDPAEIDDLADRDPAERDRLADRLAEVERAHPPLYDAAARAELSDETRESLRALGYLE